MRRARRRAHRFRPARRLQRVGAGDHRREQLDRSVGQDDAEQVPAAGQREVTAAGRLRHQVRAAAAYQRAAFRRVAQRGQRQEERAISGAAPPAGEEQRQRMRRPRHADQCRHRPSAKNSTLAKRRWLGNSSSRNSSIPMPAEIARRRHVQQLVGKRAGPHQHIAPGAETTRSGLDNRTRRQRQVTWRVVAPPSCPPVPLLDRGRRRRVTLARNRAQGAPMLFDLAEITNSECLQAAGQHDRSAADRLGDHAGRGRLAERGAVLLFQRDVGQSAGRGESASAAGRRAT